MWRPARSACIAPGVVQRPVGLVDLAPTFCPIAGIPPPNWMEGRPLPVDDQDADTRGFERVLTEWDSEQFADLWDHQPAMHAPRRRVEAPV